MIDFVDKRRHRSRFSIFRIKNLLIPYLLGGNASKSMRKEGFYGLGTRRAGRTPPHEREGLAGMRVLFWTWITLITAGLIFYSVVGLTHH